MKTIVLCLLVSTSLLASNYKKSKAPVAINAPVAPIAVTSASSGESSPTEKIVDAGNFAGEDLGAKLRAADTALGKDAGLIRIGSPGKLTTPVTLGLGHNISLTAPVSWVATVALSGRNDISCKGQGSISAAMPAGVGIFVAKDVADLTIHDCTVHLANNSPVLAAEGVHRLDMSHLSVVGGTIAQINASHGDDGGGAAGKFRFTANVVRDAPNTGGAALLLVNTTDAVVEGNTFDGISTGTQWWGGDSAHGNITQVTRTGKITLRGNQCHAVTACLWGSMGYAVNVAHNKADGCADVCFDTEGGLDTDFKENVATNCGNGCGAIFFFSHHISFRDNDFSGDARGGGLIFIKNRSADPRTHADFTVIGNKLTCFTICNAFYQEAVSQASFERNVISNGIFATAGFGQSITISQNQFTFNRALSPSAAAISAPSITGGTTLTLEGNAVTSSVSQGERAACISAIWNDYNNSDTYYIRNNRCGGSSPLPIDIITNTAGANPGPHADWHLENNVLGAGNIVHLKTTANEIYSEANNCTPTSCSNR